MLYWIFQQFDGGSGLMAKLTNVLQYQTFRSIAALVIAFTISVVFGDWVIRKLISLKMGQPIRTREEVNKLFELHGKKAGTPTMGGILIIGALLVSGLLGSRWDNPFLWVCLFVTLALGALGFAIAKGQNRAQQLAFGPWLAAAFWAIWLFRLISPHY